MDNREVYIYTLSDPNTGRPRYVGQTTNPKGRMSCHLSPAHVNQNSARSRWLQGLLEQGQRPEMSIVEVCCTDTAAEAEHNRICRLLEQGAILLNSVTDGGEGNSRGRPLKNEGERFIVKAFRLPPELWEELQAIAPRGERSAIVQEGLRRELARLKRRKE